MGSRWPREPALWVASPLCTFSGSAVHLCVDRGVIPHMARLSAQGHAARPDPQEEGAEPAGGLLVHKPLRKTPSQILGKLPLSIRPCEPPSKSQTHSVPELEWPQRPAQQSAWAPWAQMHRCGERPLLCQ